MAKYVQVWSEQAGRHILIDRSEYSQTRTGQSWQVMNDLPEYHSPVDGRLVSGRKERRTDLARHGCRPYEQGEREAALKRKDDAQKSLESTVERTIMEMDIRAPE